MTRFGGVRPPSTSAIPWAASRAIFVRVLDRRAADVGEEDDPRCGEQPWADGRLVRVHVEPSREQPAGRQRVDERVLVDDRAAGGVDECRGRLHQRQFAGADQVPGRFGQRDMDAQHVDRRQQVVEPVDVAREAGRTPGVVQHLHREPVGPPGHLPADPAVADEAEDRPVDVAGEMVGEPPARPPAGPQVGLRLRRQPGRRQDQQERQVGDRLVEDARRVADGHAERGGRADVDVVVADRGVGDDPKVPGRAGLEQRPPDRIGELAEDGVDVRRRRRELAGRPRRVLWALDHLHSGRPQRVERARREVSSNQDAGHVANLGAGDVGGRPSRSRRFSGACW